MRSARSVAMGVATFALSLAAMTVAAHPGAQRGMQDGAGQSMRNANAMRSVGPGGCEAMGRGATGPTASAQGGQHGHHAHGTAQSDHGQGAGYDHHGMGMRHGMGPEMPGR